MIYVTQVHTHCHNILQWKGDNDDYNKCQGKFIIFTRSNEIHWTKLEKNKFKCYEPKEGRIIIIMI